MDPQEIEQFRQQINQMNQALAEMESAAINNTNTTTGQNRKLVSTSKAVQAGLEGLGEAAFSTAADLYKGQRGLKVMADGVDKIADSLQVAIGIFTLFTPMGRALSVTTKIILNAGAFIAKMFSSVQKLTAEQSDNLYKAYQNLSDMGAAGAGGLERLNESLQRAGFTVAELDQFTAVIKKNAKDLTMFGANAQDGAQNLAAISGAIYKSDLGYSLEKLGFTSASLAESTASYLNLQTRLGRVQTKTANELAVEGAKFALEMDKMARLTGRTREEEEARRKALVEDERYAAFMATEARSMGYDVTALESFFGMFNDPELIRGLQHLMAGRGLPGSEEAQRVMQSDPRAYEIMQQVARGQMSFVQGAQELNRGLKNYQQTFAPLIALTGQGPGVKVGGAEGTLMTTERMAAMEAFAAQRGKTLEEMVRDQQLMAEFDKGELERQVATRRKQLNIAQTLDVTVEKFNDLNAAASGLTSVFERLSRQGPAAAGGRAATGPAAPSAPSAPSAPTPTAPQAPPRPPAPSAPAPGGAAPAPGAPSAAAPTVLDFSGLRIKSNEAYAGGYVHPNLIQLARTIQEKLGADLKYFSAFNDTYRRDPGSAHPKGTALDFVLNDPSKAAQIAALLQGFPNVKNVRDEYANPSRRATGGHIHAEISGAAGFRGTLSGPMSGYRPNLMMHGTEELSIRPSSTGSTNMNSGASEGAVIKLIERVDELVSVSKSQLNVNERILKYQQ